MSDLSTVFLVFLSLALLFIGVNMLVAKALLDGRSEKRKDLADLYKRQSNNEQQATEQQSATA